MSSLRDWLASARPLVPLVRRRASETWHHARRLEASAWRRVRSLPPRYVAGGSLLMAGLLLAVVVDTGPDPEPFGFPGVGVTIVIMGTAV